MTYARARLISGMSCVGLVVVMASAALILDAPRMWFGAAGFHAQDVGRLSLFVFGFAAVLMPVDLTCGYWLPGRFGRQRPGLGTYAVNWLRGVLVQSLVWILSSSLILWAGSELGLWGAGVAFSVSMCGLVLAQGLLARWVGALSMSRPLLEEEGQEASSPSLGVVKSTEPSFMGGIVGWPGRETVLVPEEWARLLGDEGAKAQLDRRRFVVQQGWRRQGLFMGMLWNLGGFLLCAFLPGAGVTGLGAFVTLFLWFTLWSFIGLLILPALSRPAVYAADQAALTNGVSPALLSENIQRLDRVQDDESERTQAVESVFHPIPSVNRRLAAIQSSVRPSWAPWNLARTAIYLSWAGLGFLSRSVHCNNGRPELWVLLPCD